MSLGLARFLLERCDDRGPLLVARLRGDDDVHDHTG
jgi:hypothetical protein